jgi:para-nitrobenzyl esterase
MGAIHALELPFVFGTLDLPTAVPAGRQVLDDPEQRSQAEALSASMINAWTNFAKTGDPNGEGVPAWAPYDPTSRPTLVWSNDADGTIESMTVSDPDPTRREAWASWRFPPLG